MRIRRGPATVTGDADRSARSAQPLDAHGGPGRRGAVGPEARRPPSDRKPDTPSWKGVASCHDVSSASWPALAAVAALVAALARRRRRTSPCASRATRAHARAAHRVTTTTTPVIKDGDPSHSCTGTSAAGALEHGHRRRLARHLVRRGFGDSRRGDPRRDAHVQPSAALLGLLRQRRAGAAAASATPSCTPGDDVLFVADAAPTGSPTPACSTSLRRRRATVAPGAPFTVTVTRTTTTFDAASTPSTARGPAAGATVGGATDATTRRHARSR